MGKKWQVGFSRGQHGSEGVRRTLDRWGFVYSRLHKLLLTPYMCWGGGQLDEVGHQKDLLTHRR